MDVLLTVTGVDVGSVRPQSVLRSTELMGHARRSTWLADARPDVTREQAARNIMTLKGTMTEAHLREAFAAESQSNRRYLYFAQKADVEGYPDIAALFRSVAEGETGHAFGLMDFLREIGDPTTGEPVGTTSDNLRSAIVGEREESTERYPGFAQVARDEGFEEVAEWFDMLARAERSHAARFVEGLASLE